jgi:hypothetical protein
MNEAMEALQDYLHGHVWETAKYEGLDHIAVAEDKLAEEVGDLYEGRVLEYIPRPTMTWHIFDECPTHISADNERAARLTAWYAMFCWWQKKKEGK